MDEKIGPPEEQELVNLRDVRLQQGAQLEVLVQRVDLLERACASMFIALCRSGEVAINPKLEKAVMENRSVKVTFRKGRTGNVSLMFEPVEE